MDKSDGRRMTALHLAAQNGSRAGIEYILAKGGVNVNERDKYGSTPLHFAARNVSKECVETLIAKGADVNARNNIEYTPLHCAVEMVSKECVEILIVHGAEVNARNILTDTPLHSAAGKGSEECLKCLIVNGADVNARGDLEWTPLHIAAQYGSKECVETLIANGADVNARSVEKASPLLYSSSQGHLDCMEILLKNGADVNLRDKFEKTALHYAAEKGLVECVKNLIVNGADVFARNIEGLTPLITAANEGSEECVECLIVNGADVNERFVHELTPLHFAAGNGSKGCVETLIAKGADVNARDDTNGYSPLHYLTVGGNVDCMEILLKNGADINLRDNSQTTPLIIAAERGFEPCIEYLIKNGAIVNERNKYERTALHYAAERGYNKCVKILIVNGADVNARDFQGFLAIDLSIAKGHLDCAEILEKHDPSVQNSECTASEQSIFKGDGQSENQLSADISKKPVELTLQENDSGQIHQRAGDPVIAEREAKIANSRGELLADKCKRKQYRPPKEACRYDGRLISLSNEDIKKIKDACKQENIIGQGRFGAVFKTFNDGFGIDIAIKKIVADKKEKKNSARKEMFASRILNPFILPLFSTFEEAEPGLHSVFYFVSPYCENGDLYRILEECRESPDSCRHLLNQMQRTRIALQLALAIQYLHTPVPNVRGVLLHKDISSLNVVLDQNFNARLIDFGLARENDDKTTGASGKLHYCHPDVGKPGKSASVTWDYFSLGVVIRELLTGLPPSGTRHVHLRFMNSEDIIDNLANIWPADDDESRQKASTLNIAAQNCINAQEGTFCIKKHVIDKIKAVFNEKIMDISGSNKCVLCMINPDGSEAAEQIIHRLNCKGQIKLCIACEKNSFLNPVTCYSCEATLEPIIGFGWGALLVAGNDPDDDDNANVFKTDMEKVRKMLISRAPIVMGIREEHVKTVALKKPGKDAKTEELLPLLSTAIEEINETNIHTLVVYFSCHGGKNRENFFQLASKDETLTVGRFQEMLSSLTKVRKLIIMLDRCYAEKLTIPNKIIVQINACGSEECAPVQPKGSPFTKYLIKGLQAMSEGKFCEEECRYCAVYWATRKDYITVGSLLDFVARHMAANGHPKPRCQFEGNADDVKLAYYTDEEVYLDFTINESINKDTKQVSVAFCQNMDELKTQLLKTISHAEEREIDVCVKNDTYRKENRYEICDTIDKVMMAWVLRKRLIVEFLKRETTVLYQRTN